MLTPHPIDAPRLRERVQSVPGAGKVDILGKQAERVVSHQQQPAAERDDADGKPDPMLATAWDTTPDGKTITFKNAAAPAAANVPTGSGVSGNVVTDGSGNSTIYIGAGVSASISAAQRPRPRWKSSA